MFEPRVGGASSRFRISSSALAVGLIAAGTLAVPAPPAGAQTKAKGPEASVWNLGQVPAGKRYPTTAAAHNVNCKGKHDFELSFEGAAATLFAFKDTNIVRGVGPGETKSVDVYLDARTAAPGVYDGGAIVQKCLTCPPKCQPQVQRRAIHLTLTGDPEDGGTKTGIPGGGTPGSTPGAGGAPGTGGGGTATGGGGTRTGGGGPGTTATGGGGGGPTSAPPTDESQPVRRCGGDVTEAFAEILQRVKARISKLPDSEFFEEGRATFRRRNPIVLLPDELDPATGCPLAGECRASVTFYGKCVSRSVPEEVLKAFVDPLLGLHHSYERVDFLGKLTGETEEKEKQRAAGRLGAAFAELFVLPRTTSLLRPGDFGYRRRDGVGEPSELAETAKLEHAFDLAILQGRFEACPICPTKLGFAADWSKETWTLSDGSRVEPP